MSVRMCGRWGGVKPGSFELCYFALMELCNSRFVEEQKDGVGLRKVSVIQTLFWRGDQEG